MSAPIFSDVEIDDEGDLSFKYQGRDMTICVIDSNYSKLIYPYSIFMDKSPNTDMSHDSVDMIALGIQWINMILPIKCSYYKPQCTEHSLTAYYDFDTQILLDGGTDYLESILNNIIEATSRIFMNIICGTEDGIEILNTNYSPSIYNISTE